MILYHGSSVEVKLPKLLKTQRDLDFGKGFYTTSDLEQATKWARRTAARLQSASAFVSVYEIAEPELNKLQVLRFDKPNEEWLRFVAANRKGKQSDADWDVIIGPVANDQTMPVIDLYLDGMYSESEAIKRLLPQKLKDQYTFKSVQAVRLLLCREVLRV